MCVRVCLYDLWLLWLVLLCVCFKSVFVCVVFLVVGLLCVVFFVLVFIVVFCLNRCVVVSC